MDTTNARISFSTSSEKTWEDVNPKRYPYRMQILSALARPR